jgi:hypothetical protein
LIRCALSARTTLWPSSSGVRTFNSRRARAGLERFVQSRSLY